ncbi:MAG: protein kinase domain-containing protein [Myxococcota bacterium]
MDLPVPVGHILANKYRVDRFIAAGGMGVVAAGLHLELDQPVAIKFLSMENGLSGEGAERFRREARAAAKIHSEHVVRVFDVGLLDAQAPYLVMELLEGNDLDDEVASRGALPISEAVGYVLQAIDAIAEAHAVGIVHRDLKPSNLYLAQRADGLRVVKVLDFGISKSLIAGRPSEMGLTKTSSLVGSPLFMSPEQMRSAKDVDARTDTWALGAILYYLLTAVEPFDADTLPQLCVAVMNEPHRPLRELLPGAPESLERVLDKCLAKDRALRFSSLAELAEALVPFAPGFRAHAERAIRLLGRQARDSLTPVPEVSLLPQATPSQIRGAVTEVAEAPVDAAAQTERRPALPATSETQSAWDKTGRNVINRRRVPIIATSLVAVVAVVAFMASRNAQTSGLPTSPTGVREVPAENAAAAVQTLGAATPEPERTEALAPAPVVPESQPQVVPVAPAVPSVAIAAVSPAVPAVQAKPASAVRPRAGAAPRPASNEKRTTTSTSMDVTYFGGRR